MKTHNVCTPLNLWLDHPPLCPHLHSLTAALALSQWPNQIFLATTYKSQNSLQFKATTTTVVAVVVAALCIDGDLWRGFLPPLCTCESLRSPPLVEIAQLLSGIHSLWVRRSSTIERGKPWCPNHVLPIVIVVVVNVYFFLDQIWFRGVRVCWFGPGEWAVGQYNWP